MWRSFALLAAQIAVLITATFIAVLTALTGKTAKVALTVAGRGIFVSSHLSQGKALVTLIVARIIVNVVANFAKVTE